MTLKDIEKMDALTLTPAQVGAVLNADPQVIRITAKQHPERLGYPVTFSGNRVKIPREPFLRFMRGE